MRIDGYDEKRDGDWPGIQLLIENGWFVPREVIATYLREGPPPPPVICAYIADLLDGTIHRPRGQPHHWKEWRGETLTQFAERIMPSPDRLNELCAMHYVRRYKRVVAARWGRKHGIHGKALAAAAEKFGVDENRLDQELRRSRKRAK